MSELKQSRLRSRASNAHQSEQETYQVGLHEVLDEVSRSIRYSRFEEAVKLLQVIMRASAQQKLDLVLQRYLAELSIECIELSGDSQTTFRYVEQALAQYEGQTLTSTEAKKDKLILLLRKAYLLIKLNEGEQLREHLDMLTQHLKDHKSKKVKSMLRRMHYLNSAAEQTILAEQRQLGLFQLTDQLKKQGASLVCGVR
jgi:hypothetical protein